MATNKRHTVPYRRKRHGLTNYRKRLKMLQSGKPRLVVRKGGQSIIAQIAAYDEKGDRIMCQAHSHELKKMGWPFNTGNTPAAYLTGLIIGKRAQEHKINAAIFDIGLYAPTKGSKVFTVLKGAIDAGLNIPHSPEVLPSEQRIKGEHIQSYLQIITGNENSRTRNQFRLLRNSQHKMTPAEAVESIKQKILQRT